MLNGPTRWHIGVTIVDNRVVRSANRDLFLRNSSVDICEATKGASTLFRYASRRSAGMRSRTLRSVSSFSFWSGRIRRRSKVRATTLDYFQPGTSGPLEFRDVSSVADGISSASPCVHRGISDDSIGTIDFDGSIENLNRYSCYGKRHNCSNRHNIRSLIY